MTALRTSRQSVTEHTELSARSALPSQLTASAVVRDADDRYGPDGSAVRAAESGTRKAQSEQLLSKQKDHGSREPFSRAAAKGNVNKPSARTLFGRDRSWWFGP